MDSFFLSKSIEGKPREQRSAHLILRGPTCPPPVPAPSRLCAPFARKAERGWDTASGLGACPGSLAPFVHTRGTGHRFRACAASHSRAAPVLKLGGGGAWLPGLRASLVVCRPACKAEGGWCHLQVCPSLVHLAHKRGRPRSPSTCPLFAHRLCAETQAGGRGFACGPQFAQPFCMQPGACRFPFPHGRSFACRPCAQTGGGGGPAALLLGLGVALAHRRRVREGEGGAKGGASHSCMAPFSRPPLSRMPLPSLCITGGTKKGVQTPSHSRGVPLLGLRVALALSSAQRGCKGGAKGVVCTPSPFSHAPCPWLPPFCARGEWG